MTNAVNEIKKQILIDAKKHGLDITIPSSDEEINDFYDECLEDDDGYLFDGEEGFRCSGDETDLRCEDYSRHYDCNQVARKLDSGVCVSWTYWFGGGKHGEPESMGWMDDAYIVECTQETKVVNIYTKKGK